MKIQDYDMSNFVAYCRRYNASDDCFHGTAETLLQYWEPAKNEYLYTLLGSNGLTISKPVHYERPDEEIKLSLANLLYEHQRFFNSLREQVRDELGAVMTHWTYKFNSEEDEDFYNEILDWNNTYVLMGGTLTRKIQATIGQKTIKLNEGEKIMRAIRKVCVALAAAGHQDLTNDFEQLRLDHSRILNQKTVTGELCLSIHPLDYATASDNDNGWSSCMSWKEEGCYRLGTVEMMNSPKVICAYLKSEVQEMYFDGYTWPSKKWRAWIVIDKNGIMCNRNYPYASDELSRECIKWVKELARTNLGLECVDEILPIHDWEDRTNNSIYYVTNYMYNDVNTNMLMSPSIDVANARNHYYEINYSGVANCMNCGEEIPYDDGEAGTLCCRNCRHVDCCEGCGCVLTTDDEHFYGPNDELYCEDCYYNNVINCPICQTDILTEDAVQVQVPFDKHLFCDLTENHAYMTPYVDLQICPDCVKELGITFLPNSFVFDKYSSIPVFSQEHLLDPRTVSISILYKLMDYRLDENGDFMYAHERENARLSCLDELWEDYRQYVIDKLGEVE